MASERPIILTGAASGIGRATAEKLAAKSHNFGAGRREYRNAESRCGGVPDEFPPAHWVLAAR